ncbi:Protein RMD5-like protein A-like [Oopsacas minuta]|uniref:Protein RMD5-like protein A-like n=1 Tax=Oopsacas minuta TaxID=111878 RepID=A0AAV7JG66_9METZ|nr:Protein RMD5-like protein A-like [Oopsacas minuta]
MISDSILDKNVQPALGWCKQNQEALHKIDSKLELILFELQFLLFIMLGKVECAIQFANSMYHLVSSYPKHVQQVMGSVAYASFRFQESPYASFCTKTHWTGAAELFKREAFLLKNIPVSCPLSIAIDAGCFTIPYLYKMKIVIQQQEKYDVLSKYDELPIDIDLQPSLRFHSIFACPILRQQALDVGSQPVRLICGHLIGYESVKKIIGAHGQFKCPYCPLQMHESEIMHVYL